MVSVFSQLMDTQEKRAQWPSKYLFRAGLQFQMFSRWLSGKESTCQCRRCGFNPWVRKAPLEEEMATLSSRLAWEIPRTEEAGGAMVHGVAKESDTT